MDKKFAKFYNRPEHDFLVKLIDVFLEAYGAAKTAGLNEKQIEELIEKRSISLIDKAKTLSLH